MPLESRNSGIFHQGIFIGTQPQHHQPSNFVNGQNMSIPPTPNFKRNSGNFRKSNSANFKQFNVPQRQVTPKISSDITMRSVSKLDTPQYAAQNVFYTQGQPVLYGNECHSNYSEGIPVLSHAESDSMSAVTISENQLISTNHTQPDNENAGIPILTDAIDRQLKQFHIRSTPGLEYRVDNRSTNSKTVIKDVFIPINNTEQEIKVAKTARNDKTKPVFKGPYKIIHLHPNNVAEIIDACCEFEIENVDDDKIVGGTNTDIEKHPYQALLLLYVRRRYLQCGGSIISAAYILTAGHCLYGIEKVYVQTGVTLSDDPDGNNPLIPAKSFMAHPKYNQRSVNYDIGVVKLSKKLDLSGKKQNSIKLVDAGTKLPVGANLIVTGWGLTREGGRVSGHLKEVQIQIVSDADCRKVYKERITQNMFCAGVPKGGKDACQGDSGGPGVLSNGTQIGIVSFGKGCAHPDTPGVFTSLISKEMREWVTEVTGV
ncbi:unnamed protein product [Leptidea sinapis]|uniref:Peptidase S1 domain-containing protein n=1 Tax=Leptidea sinapis TaxID=189913 RepID=A0A5E4PPN2_9NEOP|nr:unnamed protein product [Leptidea sinapis]